MGRNRMCVPGQLWMVPVCDEWNSKICECVVPVGDKATVLSLWVRVVRHEGAPQNFRTHVDPKDVPSTEYRIEPVQLHHPHVIVFH